MVNLMSLVNTVYRYHDYYNRLSSSVLCLNIICISWQRNSWNIYHWKLALFYINISSIKRLMASCCGQWLSVVRRASSVVLRQSTFDVFTLETTFVIRFLWNLVRLFVLTISRISSNMCHVGSKLGHQVKPWKILVYTLEDRFAIRFWWNLIRMFV